MFHLFLGLGTNYYLILKGFSYKAVKFVNPYTVRIWLKGTPFTKILCTLAFYHGWAIQNLGVNFIQLFLAHKLSCVILSTSVRLILGIKFKLNPYGN